MFHFESFWPQLDRFREAVEMAWQSVQSNACPFDTLARKLRATSKALESWRHKKVGHVNSLLAFAREVLHQLEMAQDSRVVLDNEVWLMNRLEKHTLALSSLKRTVVRTRSRISWLKDGDANTVLFHLHARHRKRKGFIGKLVAGDQVFTGHEDKERVIFDFYNGVLGSTMNNEVTVNLDELDIASHI